MPQQIAPPSQQPVDMETQPFVHGMDPMSIRYALDLVNQTFNHFETQRKTNEERRWLTQEALYLGWLPQKMWEGTQIPRSSLGYPLTFDQIETAIPIIYSALFESSSDWFELISDTGDAETARGAKGYLEYLLEHEDGQLAGTLRNQVLLTLKDILLFGNGFLHLEWDSAKKRPAIQALDIRDVYVDRATATPCIDNARAVVIRQLRTIDEMVELRKDPRMNIPTDDVLNYFAKNRPLTSGDEGNQFRGALVGQNWTPDATDSRLPSDQRLEVLVYYSKTRIIWTLNRQWLCYNGNNPYGCIPVLSAPCYPVPNRFYALSMADVQEGNQRYIEGLLNNRLDEINLATHPPRIQKRGAIMTPAQQRWRPGAVITAGDAKDVLFQQPVGALQNVFNEIQFLILSADKRTGVTGMAQGSPTPGNANRSATGIQAQTRGSTSRMTMITKLVEDYMLVPLLHTILLMVRTHVSPRQWLPSVQGDKRTAVPGSAVTGGNFRFRIMASSRMMAKEQLQQILGPLLQFVTQGPFMQALSMSGQTIDFEELFELVQQATGTKRRFKLVRPMTKEEQQAKQQPPPEVIAEQKRAEQDAQTRLQMGQMKSETEIQKAQIMKAPDQPDPGEQEREVLKLMVAREMANIKVQAEREKHQMEMEARRQELALRGQEGRMTQTQSAQKLQHEFVSNAMKRSFQDDKQDADLEAAKAKAKLAAKPTPKPSPKK